jgi:hypothetical protein
MGHDFPDGHPACRALTPDIITRDEWGAHEPGYGNHTLEGLFPSDPTGYFLYTGNLASEYYIATIHHVGDDIPFSYMKALQEMEMQVFWDIPYHFVIFPDGKIYEGRSLNARGAAGVPNSGNVQILWVGDFVPGYDISDARYGQVDLTDDVYGPTPAAFASTVKLLTWLDSQLGIDYLYGHGELINAFPYVDGVKPTSCPGAYAMPYVNMLRKFISP